MANTEYSITFTADEIRDAVGNISDDLCDDFAAGLIDLFNETFFDNLSEYAANTDFSKED